MGYLVIEFKGGIGNVLFQYAAASSLASAAGATLVTSRTSHRERGLLTSYLGHAPPLASRFRERATLGWSVSDPRPVRLGMRLLGRIARQLSSAPNWNAEPFRARPEQRDASSPLGRLHGYFQHPSWFDDQAPAIAQSIHGHVVRDFAATRPYVAVHLRRGDYLRLGWALPLAYYRAALALTRAQMGMPVVVVGDDELAVEGLKTVLRSAGFDLLARDDAVSPPPERDARGDFVVVSLGADVVLANSTFSWWGARTGDSVSSDPDRIVTFPAGWLTGRNPNVLLRPGWHLVDAT